MRYLSNIFALTTIIFLLFVPYGSNANAFQQNELAKAIQLFDKKQYEEAEKLFKILVSKRPDDFMVNYFYGACRTENGHFSDRDLAYLEKASKEVSPLDIDYYFGIQYQAKGEFEKALTHYNKFKETADDAELNRVKLAEKIEQCKNQDNPFKWISNAEYLSDSINLSQEIEIDEVLTLEENLVVLDSINTESEIKSDSLISREESFMNSLKITDNQIITEEQKPIDLPIDFSVNHEIAYHRLSNFKTEDGKQNYEEATKKQKELDTVLKTANSLREIYSAERNREIKDSLGQRILGLEERSYELKSEVNALFSKSKFAEVEYWENATEDEKTTFINSQRKPADQPNEETKTANISESLEIPDILIDNSTTIKPSEPVNKDLSYKIQIGAYSRGLPATVKKLYDKLSLIRKIDNYTDDRGVVVYTTGNLNNFEDAMTMLKQVQQEGVEDAIIAAYFKGKRITLTEAKALEGI